MRTGTADREHRRLRARGGGRHRHLRHRPASPTSPRASTWTGPTAVSSPWTSSTSPTSREGVFAAGDAVSGSASVIKAIASGRKAAVAVDKYPGGQRHDRPEAGPRRSSRRSRLGREKASPRCRAWATPASFPRAADRLLRGGQGLERGAGRAEKRCRCLQCDLRLNDHREVLGQLLRSHDHERKVLNMRMR